MDVFEIGRANRFANNGSDFGIREIALAEQFASLFAVDAWVQQGIGGDGSDVASGNHGQAQIRTQRSDGVSHLVNRVHLGKRVLHEVRGTQVKHVGTADLIELLFEL